MGTRSWWMAVSWLVFGMVGHVPDARAQPDNRTVLADMTWPEVTHAIRDGDTTIIIPIGGTEQSGPFIAVGKHNVRAFALAQRIAEGLGHTLVAPVVAYVPEGATSPRTSHMRFAGTISVPPEIFEGVLIGAAESFRVQGFRRIAFISDHGGYRAFVHTVVQRLNARWDNSAQAVDVTRYYGVIKQDYAPWLRARGMGWAIGEHADLMDTSLMLAVDPGMVRQSLMAHSSKFSIRDGVYGGDPRPATAALGQVGVDMQVNAAIAQLRNAIR